jgi:putative transposase
VKNVVKRLRFPLEVMLVCVRWYVAYPLSLRNLEEMLQERGVKVDHATIHRWIIKLLPVLETTFRKRKAAVGTSWRMDETYVKVGGQSEYLYRAVDKGATPSTACSPPSAIGPRRSGRRILRASLGGVSVARYTTQGS